MAERTRIRTSPLNLLPGYRSNSNSISSRNSNVSRKTKIPPFAGLNLNRTLSKLNYHIHTDAIKSHLIPVAITPAQAAVTYANEADMLNIALFGQTAKQWRDAIPHWKATCAITPPSNNCWCWPIGRHERRTHSYGVGARRSPQASERNRNPPDAGSHFRIGNQTTQGISECVFFVCELHTECLFIERTSSDKVGTTSVLRSRTGRSCFVSDSRPDRDQGGTVLAFCEAARIAGRHRRDPLARAAQRRLRKDLDRSATHRAAEDTPAAIPVR